jgi:uncharacterized protein YciI
MAIHCSVKEASMKLTAMLLLGAMLAPATLAAGQQPAGPALQKLFLYRVQAVRKDLLTTSPTDEESKALEGQFNYLKDLSAKGVVLLVGRTMNRDETSFGIVIFHAESEEAARKIMEGDPAVRNGVFHATLFPFQIALAASAQGR